MIHKRARSAHRRIARSQFVGLALACGLLVGASTTSAAALRSDASGQSEDLDEVTIALGPDMTSLDPQLFQNAWVRGLHFGNVAEELTRIVKQDDELVLVPALAESWEQVDDLTWRIDLRQGVEFHNGEPFNAEVVKFSFERMVAEEFSSSTRASLVIIDSVEVIDDYTVAIHTTEPAPLLDLGVLPVLPMVPPDYTQSDPNAMDERSIGTGPYEMVSHTADEVVLEKNPDYWGGTPSGPNRVTFVSRPELSSRLAGLAAGELDIISDVPVEARGELPNVTEVPADQLEVYLVNANGGPTDDPLVREAIVKAINREEIVDAIFGDAATVAPCQFGVPGVAGHFPDDPLLSQPQPHDPDEARSLLEEADAVGATVRILLPIGRFANNETVAQIVAQQLTDVGFNAEVVAQDFQTYVGSASAPAESRVELTHSGLRSTPPVIAESWSRVMFEGTPFFNFPWDEYPGLEEKMVAGLAESNPERRDELLHEVANAVCESNAYVFMYRQTLAYGYRDGLTMVPRGDEILQLVDIQPS